MADLIDAILDGVKVRSFFYSQYYGALEYRPLTLKETEECYSRALEGRSMEATNFITTYRLGGPMDGLKTVELAMEVNSIRSVVNAWIVYHAVKDFQPPRWRQVKDGLPLGIQALHEDACCLEIDTFARQVLALSVCPRGRMESFLKTGDGKVIGTAIWKLDMPLVQNLGDLTELQLSFLSTSLDKYTNEWKQEEGADVAQALKKLDFKPTMQYDKAQLDIIAKLDEARKAKGVKR
jgi:hypothetical protein